jgi:hypothetical protein
VSFGRIVLLIVGALIVAGLAYTGVWHLFTLFFWQHPMLSWLPLLALIAVGVLVGTVRSMMGAGGTPLSAPAPATGRAGSLAAAVGTLFQRSAAPSAAAPDAASAEEDTEAAAGAAAPAEPVPPAPARRTGGFRFAWGWGFLAGFAVLLIGLWFTLISKPAVGLDDIDYTVVDELPQQTQPRLLPRAGIRDDPNFRDADEIHLVRDPRTGELLWTGEWHGNWLGGRSDGFVVRSLDELVAPAEVTQGGFEESLAGVRPSTLDGQAYRKHPFSKIQYPVVVPEAGGEAIAIAPYMGYKGFPFRYPYLKGVLVYHQDGTLEDLSPDEAMARPELVRTGRLVPETVARAQAEALARSDDFKGDIHNGENNRQPYLTAIDRDTTAWVTIIDAEDGSNVRAVVLADSSTGETTVWEPSEGEELISSERVLNEARALPLRWEEERCCDSDGNSYTVTLSEVVEARLAFKNGKPFYMVSVVPTDDLALAREIEYTLVIDAETGIKIAQFDHVNGGANEDAQLQAFFR